MHHNQIASEMESNKTPYTSMTPQNKWLRHFLALNKKKLDSDETELGLDYHPATCSSYFIPSTLRSAVCIAK